MDAEVKSALAAFSFHGISVDTDKINGASQVPVEVCPFCGDERNLFFISAKKTNAGQFHCKKCDVQGNKYVFLDLYYNQCLSETTDEHWKELGKLRETTLWQAFREDGWAYDTISDRWLFPIRNADDSLVNLKVYLGPDASPKIVNTTGCALHLYGMETLQKDGPIVICEGESDATLLRYIWPQVDDRPVTILAVPGKDQLAPCLKRDIKSHFANRDLILLWDSGEEAVKSQLTAATVLSREYHARSVLCIHWPESCPPNFDITDLINQKGKDEAWAKIQSWLRPFNYKPIDLGPDKKVSLSTVIRVFRETGVHVNSSFSDAIRATLATTIAIRYGGIPLWMYLIGKPGSGKSLILDSTIQSPLCHYQTDLNYTTLVSGFKTEPDPSLMARIMNRVLVLKDYTTIMDKNETQQRELLGLLRDGYDGEIVREFGNGVVRRYPDPSSGQDRCYFGIIAGVTPKIHTYNKAALGERFIKFSMGKTTISEDDILRKVLQGASEPWKDADKANRRQQVVSQFIEHVEMGDKPVSIDKFGDQLIALASFAAVARTRPERDRSSGDLLYEANAESASRLLKQLVKLTQSLSAVSGLKKVDSDCLRIVKAAAWTTGYGWHRNIYSSLWHLRGKAPTVQEIAARGKLSSSSTSRVLMDLRDLGIAEKAGKKTSGKGGGRPADEWKLTDRGAELIIKSKIFEKA